MRDVVFKASALPESVYGWSKEVFGQVGLSITIPPFFSISQVIDVVTSNGTSLPMAIDHMNLNQLTDISGFAAAGSVRPIYPTNMTVPEIQMDLGYVEMGVLVQSTRVATAEMPQGLHMAASDPSVALNARAVVLRDDGIAPAVQNLINSMVGGPDAAPSSSIGVTGLMFGASKEEAFVTFSKIIISLDTAALMPLLSKTMMAVQEKLVAPGLIGFGGANMAVESSTLVTADAQVTFKNPLPISASLGGVRMEVSLDGKSAIQASTGELLLASGSSSLDLPAHLGLSDGSNGIAASVAALVNDLIALRAPSTSVSISGLVIKAPGSVSSVTDAATIDQFKNIVLRLPASILDKINPLRPNSPIDVSAMLPSMDNIIEKVNPVFHSFSLDTLPNAKISSSISVGYTNPVPLSVKLPYARLVVQVDSTSIAIVHVSGLSLAIQNGQMVPQIMVAFGNDNDRVAEIVASLVDSAISELTCPFSTSLVKRDQQRKFGLNGIYFGMSEADSNGILSAVDVDVSFLAEKISMDQVKRLLTRYIPINFPASIEDLSKYFSPSITELDVAMLPAHSMDLKAGATLSLPFAINSLIGFLESDFGINQSPMASVSLASGLHITSRSSGGEGSVPATLDAGARIQFTDDISCAVSVARLIENTLQGSPYDTTLVVRNIVVGYSPTDFIKAFSRISISVSFDSLLKPIRPLIDAIIENVKENLLKSIHEMEKSDAGIKQIASSVSIPIYGGIAITPKSASVSMKPGSKIDLGLELGISMPFPVSANIPYMSLVGSLDTLSAVVVEANGFSVKPNSVNDVSLSTTLSIQDSDALSEKLQSIVADFMITGRISSLFGVNSVYFGSSSSDKISILDKFGISMDVNPYLPPVVDFMSKRGQSLINSLISTMETITMEDIQSGNPLHLGYGILISMRKAHLEMQQHQSVYIGIDMGIVFPFKLSVDIPYIGMDVGIDSVQAMGVQVNGFKVGDSVTTSVINGSSLLSVGTLLSIKDTTDLADKLASVADNLMAGNNFTTSSSQIVFGGAAFGASQADHVKALNRVVIQFGLNSRFIVSLSNTMKRLSSSVDPIKLVSALGINITDMAASLQPGQIIDMSASASFKLPFPIIFKVGYMSAFGGLDGIDVSRLDLDGGLSVGSQTVNGLVLKGSIFMPSAEMVRKKVAAFVDHVMVKGISNLDEIATFSQLKFGFSSQDYIKALSKIQIGAKISQIITQSLIDKIVLEYFGFPSSNDISLDFVVSLLYKFVKDRGVVNSAILDASKFGSIIAGVDAGVTKMELIAKVDVGYAAMTPLFNKLV